MTTSYLLTIDDIRDRITIPQKPSYVNITTITLLCNGVDNIDIPKIRAYYEKYDNNLKIKSTTGNKDNVIDTMINLSTKFYNQITITYKCSLYRNTKSIKVFPNGTIHITGGSNPLNCQRVLMHLSTILNHILNVSIKLDDFRIVMINSNFSINYLVNLLEIESIFSDMSMFNVSFEPDKYSAVKIKFKPAEDMKQVTVSIFSTGKVIITGAETLKEIASSYRIINEIISMYDVIRVQPTVECDKLGIIMGYSMDKIVPYLKSKNIKPWEYTRFNQKINF